MERLVFKILGVIQIIAGLSIVGISGKIVHDFPSTAVGSAGYIIIGVIIFVNGVIGLATVNKWMDVIYLIASGVGSTAATAMLWISASSVHGFNSIDIDINNLFGLSVGLLVCSIFSCIASLAGTSIMATTICRHYSA